MSHRNGSPAPNPAGGSALFSGPVEPPKAPPAYVLMCCLAGLAALLVPLIYLGLIGGIGWGAWELVARVLAEAPAPPGRRPEPEPLKYVLAFAIVVVAVLVVFFLLKPLVARRPAWAFEPTLDRGDAPAFFAFLDELCGVINAPRPKVVKLIVEPNAAAGLGDSLWNLVVPKPTLVVGLSLVESMDVRQFAGVLAHELGHLSQGIAMRASMAQRLVMHWLARAVYERDAWDVWLMRHRAETDVYIAAPLWIASGMIAMGRGVLWCLMWCCLPLERLLARQLEYNADQYEARVSGVTGFEGVCRTLDRLRAGWALFHREVGRMLKDERLPDDLPALIAVSGRRIPARRAERLCNLMRLERGGWLDTHPSTEARLRNVQGESSKGVCAAQWPARELFPTFELLCKAVTRWCHSGIIEPGWTVKEKPTAPLVAQFQAERRAGELLDRVLGPDVASCLEASPLFLRMETIQQEDAGVVAKRWRAHREAARSRREAAQAGARRAAAAMERLEDLGMAETLVRGGFRFGAEWKLPRSIPAIEQAQSEAHAELDGALSLVEPFTDALRAQVAAALGLLGSPQAAGVIADAAELREGAEKYLRMNGALRTMATAAAGVQRNRMRIEAMMVLSRGLSKDKGTKEALRQVRESMENLQSAAATIGHVEVPFALSGEGLLYEALIPPYFKQAPLEDVPVLAASFCDTYTIACRMTLAGLLDLASRVESGLKQAARAAAEPA